MPLDDRREWYRYHHLFADLLRLRLQQAQPDQVPALHRRASAWYEQNGLTTAAIGHALSAADPEHAADLVEQAAESTLMRSEFATFLGWIEALPGELVHSRPRLCLYYALSLVLNGYPLDVARSHIQSAVEADRDGSIAGEVAQQETGKGERADPGLLNKALDVLLEKGPDVLELVLEAILSPAAAAGKEARMLARKAKEGLEKRR